MQSNQCHHCGWDALRYRKSQGGACSPDILNLNAAFATRMLSGDHKDFGSDTKPDRQGLRALLGLMLRATQGRKLLASLSRQTSIAQSALSSRWFESLRVVERRWLIAVLEAALQRGLDSMIESLRDFGVTRQTLQECVSVPSTWLSTTVLPHLADNPRFKCPPYYWAEWKDPILALRRRMKTEDRRYRAEARARVIEQLIEDR